MIEADPRSFVLLRFKWADYLLTTDRVANVLDCFSNFPSGFAKAFLDLATRIIYLTFGGEIVVVQSPANSLFRFAFSLIPFSFNFIFIR